MSDFATFFVLIFSKLELFEAFESLKKDAANVYRYLLSINVLIFRIESILVWLILRILDKNVRKYYKSCPFFIY